ncbi:hypothetical protein DFH09DRAFT_1087901 [Mycena vulgaris]|nr:hypothetical protein DFH09DRAFT_1087901 [Mycena vulgaris]
MTHPELNENNSPVQGSQPHFFHLRGNSPESYCGAEKLRWPLGHSGLARVQHGTYIFPNRGRLRVLSQRDTGCTEVPDVSLVHKPLMTSQLGNPVMRVWAVTSHLTVHEGLGIPSDLLLAYFSFNIGREVLGSSSMAMTTGIFGDEKPGVPLRDAHVR